jgi:hypothetical protein
MLRVSRNHDERYGLMAAKIISEQQLSGELALIFKEYSQIFGDTKDSAKLDLIRIGERLLA